VAITPRFVIARSAKRAVAIQQDGLVAALLSGTKGGYGISR
jgi:hypothetical protein